MPAHRPETHPTAPGADPEQDPSSHPEACVTCGEPLVGRYCHACGEKRRDPSDLTLRAFAAYALEAVTNADAKLYRTLRVLFTRPGMLTREFIAGRRTPYVGPLQVFLLFNVVYFLSLQTPIATQAFTTDLAYHFTQPIYGSAARSMVEARIGELPRREPYEPVVLSWVERWDEEQQQFRERFNEVSPRYANSLVIAMVPMLAIGLRLLRRRSSMVCELVFSLHFKAVLLFFMMALPALLIGLFRIGVPIPQFVARDAGFTLLVGATIAAWFTASFHRVHGDGLIPAVLRALVALPLLFIVTTLYRGLLFFVIFAFE